MIRVEMKGRDGRSLRVVEESVGFWRARGFVEATPVDPAPKTAKKAAPRKRATAKK